jgi:hypothetical protein
MRQRPGPRLAACGLLALAAVSAGCTGSVPPAAREGSELLVLTANSAASNPDFSGVASGVFRAKGTFPGVGNGQDASLAKLPGGTFVVSHPAGAQKVTRESVNARSCAVVLDRAGPFTVGQGSGRYKGITGYGTDTAQFTGVMPRTDGKCVTSASAQPVRGTARLVITAKGSVLLPP